MSFKGRGLLFFRNVFFYVLASAPVLSLCLMGAAWQHVFLTLMAVSLALLPVAAFIISRIDGFSFDDQKQIVIRNFGRMIPYSSVRSVELNQTAGMVQVILKHGRAGGCTLVSALDAREKPRLMEELKKRLPGIGIREQQHRDWKILAVLIALLIAATAVFHLYFYKEYPAVSSKLAQKEWTAAITQKVRKEEYRTGAYRIALPGRYRYRGGERDMLFFEDRERQGAEIKIIAPAEDPVRARNQAMLALMTGMGEHVRALETSYRARFGIVPLMIKGLALMGMKDVQLTSVRQGEWKAIITQGTRRGRESTDMLVAGSGGGELNFFITGARPDDQELSGLIAGIRRRPE